MSEFVRMIGYFCFLILCALVGVCVLVYYLIKCVINREDEEE